MTSQPPGPKPEAVEAPNGHPPAPASSTSQGLGPGPNSSYTVNLGSNVSLTIEGDCLLVQGGTVKNIKKSRTCGVCPPGPPGLSGAPKPRSIPLYNILWAELSKDEQTLTIDHAEPVSTTHVRAAQLTLPTTATGDSTDVIAKWATQLLAAAYGPAPRRKRAYVLVNPHAGPGGAQRKWDRDVRPLFEAARMPLTVHTTTAPREAIALCEGLDLDRFDVVVACSGDGLPYEVFNGLARRPDARRALRRLAVAQVPCGSGNALACNALGTHRASLAALAIAKGVPTPMDLVSVTQRAGAGEGGGQGPPGAGVTRSLSFLSQTLGIMAEADLGTEHLRWMGEHRFTYGTVTRILKKKEYPCDLWVKMEIEHKDAVRAHYRRERENSSASAAVQAVDGEGATEAEAEGGGLPPLKYGTVCDQPPEGWVKIPADNIGSFFAGNLAYMAPDVIFHGAALFNDGLLDIYTVNGAVPARRVPGLLTACFSNAFFDHDLVAYYKVSAFRIAPKYATEPGETGFISVDGEAVPFGPFQAEVHKGLGTVITRRGMGEAPGPKGWDEEGSGGDGQRV